jgi:hypothetical protein
MGRHVSPVGGSEEGVGVAQRIAYCPSWRHASVPLYVLVLAIVYVSVLAVPYAFSDTYTMLAQALRHQLWERESIMLQGGRPLLALVTSLSFPYIHSVAELRWVRLFGLLGLASFASIYASVLRRQGAPRALVWGLPLLTACMPPFQVYVAWAVCAPYTWAAALAGFAFVALGLELRWPLRIGLSVTALMAALFIYQPAAMMFWVFAASVWLTGERLPSARSLATAAAVMVIVMTFDLVVVEILPGFAFSASDYTTRTDLVTDLFGKLTWFVMTPLREAANLTNIEPSTTVALAVAAWIATGLVLYWRDHNRRVIRFAALAAALVALSYLPNLVVAENWASYRTQVALTSLVLLYVALALLGWLRYLKIPQALTGIVVVAVGAAAFVASDTVKQEFVVPQEQELLLVKQALTRRPAAAASHLYLRLASWEDHLAPISRWDEFGLPSSCQPRAAASMAWLLTNVEGIAAGRDVAAVLPHNGNIAKLPPDSCIVDLSAVLRRLPVQCEAAARP